jgi:hypothetical protein
MEDKLSICCVLRSGGDFGWEYADKLYSNINKYVTREFEFIIFTDLESFPVPDNIKVLPLKTDLRSYWSKLEIFNLKGNVLYFDLDTMIVGSLDNFITELLSLPKKDRFYMMEAFHPTREFSSGIMAWVGDYSYILNELVFYEAFLKYGKWEQDYIKDKLTEITSINDYLNIASYKHHCKDGVDSSTDIVVFHGKPRPKDIKWEICLK